MIPPSPCIGSTKTAAVFSVIASSIALDDPNSTETNPGVCGPKSSFELGSLEKLIMVVVLP